MQTPTSPGITSQTGPSVILLTLVQADDKSTKLLSLLGVFSREVHGETAVLKSTSAGRVYSTVRPLQSIQLQWRTSPRWGW